MDWLTTTENITGEDGGGQIRSRWASGDERPGYAFELISPWLPVNISGWQFSSGSVRGAISLRWQPQQNIGGEIHLKAYHIDLATASARVNDGYRELDIKDIANRSMTLSVDAPKLGLRKETTLRNLAVKARLLDLELTVEPAPSMVSCL